MTKAPAGDSSSQSPATGTGLSPAVAQVLASNRERFLRFLRRRVTPADAAEEILQEAVVRGIVNGGTLRDGRLVLPWFYRLLRNAVVDHARSEATRRRALAALERETERQPGLEADQDLIEAACNCVISLMAALRTDYATALNRVDLGGEPIDTFARATGITRNNASVRLLRARRALRRAVDRNCGSCAEHGGYLCECRSEPHRTRVGRGQGRICR